MVTQYKFRGQRIGGELARQLDESRVTGLSGTEGVVVYTSEGPYFVQAYLVNGGERIPRNNIGEFLQGLLETDTKKFVSKNKSSRKFEIHDSYSIEQLTEIGI